MVYAPNYKRMPSSVIIAVHRLHNLFFLSLFFPIHFARLLLVGIPWLRHLSASRALSAPIGLTIFGVQEKTNNRLQFNKLHLLARTECREIFYLQNAALFMTLNTN